MGRSISSLAGTATTFATALFASYSSHLGAGRNAFASMLAFIFSMLGIKRNIFAIFGFLLVAGLNILLISPALSIGFTLPLILPLFYLPALGGVMSMYAAYPNIRRYMIDGKTELSSYTIEADEDEIPEENTEDAEVADATETELTPPPPEAD